jgi:hypothetical protein
MPRAPQIVKGLDDDDDDETFVMSTERGKDLECEENCVYCCYRRGYIFTLLIFFPDSRILPRPYLRKNSIHFRS